MLKRIVGGQTTRKKVRDSSLL